MKDNNLKKENNVENSTENINKVEMKYVVSRRKPSFFLSLILILIGALMAIIVMLICFGNKIVAETPNVPEITENTENNESVKEVRKLNLDIKGDFITLLYGKLLVDVRNVPVCYSGKVVEYSSIEDNTKAVFAVRSLKGEELPFTSVKDKLDNKVPSDEDMQSMMGFVTVISLDEADNKYKSLFGDDKSIPHEDIETGMGYVYEFVKEDSKFYGHYYMGGGGSSFTYSRKINKVEANEDSTEVYIYDSFACADFFNSSEEGNLWGFYGNTEKTSVVKTNVIEVFEDSMSKFDGKTMTDSLKEIVDSGSYKYKHTFKLDKSGDYYWSSSEPVK